MRTKILALGAAVAIGMAATTSDAMAFGGGGHGGVGGGGHGGGGFGGGGFTAHAAGIGAAHAGPMVGAVHGPMTGGVARGPLIAGAPGFARGGAWSHGGWVQNGGRGFHHRRLRPGVGIGLGLGGLYAYSPGYCDPYDPYAYTYGYCGYDYTW